MNLSLVIVTFCRREKNCLPKILQKQTLLASTQSIPVMMDEIIAQAPSLVVSFGFAGALNSSLKTGDVVVPHHVINGRGQSFACHPSACRQLRTMMDAHDGIMMGSDDLIASARLKKQLFKKNKSIAVDMESHYLAEWAHGASVPFVVMRAIVDEADDDISLASLQWINKQGGIAYGALVRSCLMDGSVPMVLCRMGWQSRRARISLRRGGKALLGLCCQLGL